MKEKKAVVEQKGRADGWADKTISLARGRHGKKETQTCERPSISHYLYFGEVESHVRAHARLED